jgi:hypothetical protein
MLCPRCNYDLTGLPEIHTCPECGLNYDPDTVAIELRGVRHPVAVLFWAVIWIALLVFILQRGAPRMRDWFFLTVAGAGFLVDLYRSFIRSGLRNRLVINHEGLHFKLSCGDDRIVRWEEIGLADRTWVTGTLRIRGPDGSSVFVCPFAEFNRNKKMVLRSIAEINRLKKIYTPTK